METRIAPIENPSSILMKVVYFITKKIFGKVITPLKVAYSRLPVSFIMFANKISALDKKLSIDYEIALMVRIRVAQTNTCHFCIDIANSFAMRQFKDQEKFYNLEDYKTNSLYSEKERAALRFAEELTVNKEISDGTFAAAAAFFNERELVELSWLVATEHYYNMINIAFKIESDGLCDIQKRKRLVVNV